MTVIENGAVDLRLVPTRTTRHEFHRQIARLERELSASLVSLDPARRPLAKPSPTAQPHLLSDAELESTRDALVARLGEIEALLVRQSADRDQARALLKRMSDAPAEYRWVTVTTKETGDEGCRTWQSVPVMGPVGILGNWWRIRMSSGCP
ncbi:MAG TPA: hypothetical protein VJ782_02080 [Aeromicrobium sp.]|nr:hypothetical protein [Aeromicrobium sp.]